MNEETPWLERQPFPEALSHASSAPHFDRISVRDYVRFVEIGAFQQERGTSQRVRFNVVLEVRPTNAADDDDVDKVISYDTIVDAIEAELAAERINLLETLAERIAARCLVDKRAAAVHVRLEKLDRIPGALGVEIHRWPADAVLKRTPIDPADAPEIYFLPNDIIGSDDLKRWLDAITGLSVPAIIALGPTPQFAPVPDATHPQVARRIGLLSIEQNAWRLAGQDDRCVVVASRTELDWARKHDRLSVWAPSKIVLDATDRPNIDPTDPLGLALWFSDEIGGRGVTLPGTTALEDERLRLVDPKRPGDLTAR